MFAWSEMQIADPKIPIYNTAWPGHNGADIQDC